MRRRRWARFCKPAAKGCSSPWPPSSLRAAWLAIELRIRSAQTRLLSAAPPQCPSTPPPCPLLQRLYDEYLTRLHQHMDISESRGYLVGEDCSPFSMQREHPLHSGGACRCRHGVPKPAPPPPFTLLRSLAVHLPCVRLAWLADALPPGLPPLDDK